MGPVADHQVLADLDAAGHKAVDLGDEARRVDDHAAGDHALDLGAEDAAGDQRELVGLAAGDDRMAGVGPALIADDNLMLPGQEIDDLSLGLVPPLQANHTRSGHGDGPDMKQNAPRCMDRGKLSQTKQLNTTAVGASSGDITRVRG